MYRGRWTAAEWWVFIVLLFVVVCLICLFSFPYLYAPEVEARAKEMSRSFVRQHHASWTNTTTTCESMDNDRNGYVTCSVSRTDSTAVVPLECPACMSDFFCVTRTCRPARQTFPSE